MIFLLIDRPSRPSDARSVDGRTLARAPNPRVGSIDRSYERSGIENGGGKTNRRRVNDSAMCNFHAESILARLDARRCICPFIPWTWAESPRKRRLRKTGMLCIMRACVYGRMRVCPQVGCGEVNLRDLRLSRWNPNIDCIAARRAIVTEHQEKRR